MKIERTGDQVRIRLYTARPGIVIGKKGAEIEILKKDIEKLIDKKVTLDIQEVRRPEADAMLVAENIAQQLVRRVAFRRAMKKAVSSALRFGVQGIKIRITSYNVCYTKLLRPLSRPVIQIISIKHRHNHNFHKAILHLATSVYLNL